MLVFDFQPFPILTTERLVLRKLTLEDTAEYFGIRCHPKVAKYQARPEGETIEKVEKILKETLDSIDENKVVCWAICPKGNHQKLIGTVGCYRTQFENYRTEIGYELHPDFWGKGMASEAVQAVLDFIFTKTKVHSVEANIDPMNLPSARVLERNNFIKEACFRENYFTQGRFTDSAIYSLLKSRHLAMKSRVG